MIQTGLPMILFPQGKSALVREYLRAIPVWLCGTNQKQTIT
jgi:hypothetical protein